MQELDDMSEQAGENVATELTIQDTIMPSQPAAAMHAVFTLRP